MIVLYTILGTLLTTAAGLLLGGLLAWCHAQAVAMGNFEGKRSYFVASIAVLCALFCFVVTPFVMLHALGPGTAWAWIGDFLLVQLGLAVLPAAVLGYYWLKMPKIYRGNEPTVQFEMLPPQARSWPELSQVAIELNTNKNTSPCAIRSSATASLNGHTPLAGSVDLYFRTSQRAIILRLLESEAQIFPLRLPASPKKTQSQEWTPWEMAQFIHKPGMAVAAKATPEEAFSLRYRVVVPSGG